MGLERLEVVEISLPVLDETILIGGEQPLVVMSVFHDPHSTVMCLHNGFEVKSGAVP
jgi:hypothetical protein